MNHSINILLWIMYTLFALLYVNVNGGCAGNTPDACIACGLKAVCDISSGPNGCKCEWTTSYNGLCLDLTCNPTVNPTEQPSIPPSTSPSKFPSIPPSTFPSNFPTNSPSKLPSNSPSQSPSILQFTKMLSI
eukprot:279761_1